MRLLAVLAMTAALFAAFLPASPTAAGVGETPTAELTFQVYTCPPNYAGEEYLFDCTPGPAGDPITVAGGAVGPTVDGTTADDGTYALNYPVGQTNVTLGLSAPNSFYVACFDTTSGTEDFLFTGAENTITLDTSTGGSYSCRFYVIPTEGAPVPPIANAAFQVFTCPALYDGDTYLNDCDPVGVDVLLSPGTEFDPDNAIDGTAIDDSTTGFGPLDPGSYSAFLNASERVNSFYYACFDTSSGSEVFLFDGEASYLTADIAAGGLLSCRWYIVPQDAGTDSASAGFEVRTCPVAYAGDDYRNDCPPVEGSDPVDVLLSGGPVLDPETALVGTTGINGLTTFTPLVPGTYTAGLDVSGEFADFSLACFDASSGSDVFLFDGDANVTTFQLPAYGYTICRWYIIPEELAGGSASPSASATAAPSANATASPAPSSAGGIATLPNTGAGPASSPDLSMVALSAALLAVIAAAFVTRRLVTTRS